MKTPTAIGEKYIYSSSHKGDLVATVVSQTYRTVVRICYMEDGKEVYRTVPTAFLREIDPTQPLVIQDGKVISG